MIYGISYGISYTICIPYDMHHINDNHRTDNQSTGKKIRFHKGMS